MISTCEGQLDCPHSIVKSRLLNGRTVSRNGSLVSPTPMEMSDSDELAGKNVRTSEDKLATSESGFKALRAFRALSRMQVSGFSFFVCSENNRTTASFTWGASRRLLTFVSCNALTIAAQPCLSLLGKQSLQDRTSFSKEVDVYREAILISRAASLISSSFIPRTSETKRIIKSERVKTYLQNRTVNMFQQPGRVRDDKSTNKWLTECIGAFVNYNCGR